MDFEGHDERECGDHRTVGPHRAWCLDCTEWCYPEGGGCRGCRLPSLEAEVERLRAQVAALTALCAVEHSQLKTSSDTTCPGCGQSFNGERGLRAHQTARFVAMDCKPR